LVDGTLRLSEIHWYEAHGIGNMEFKLFFDRIHRVEESCGSEST
jgi:hypothetical protein